MKFVRFIDGGVESLGVLRTDALWSAPGIDPRELDMALEQGQSALLALSNRLENGRQVNTETIAYLPPFPRPEKIICVGLNYREHANESGFKTADYPALFGRYSSSLIGHREPIVRPTVSKDLDFEGELVAIIGKAGRNIPRERALAHVAGYSLFNDASIRDYQFKSAQWTIGKNFDATGAFGPAFVTTDELPEGARGLRLQTRLNGLTVQDASTEDMIFDVAQQVSLLSDVMTLRPGDVIVTGTPSGVGVAREPKLYMKPGDRCEVEIEGIGILSNPIEEQGQPSPPRGEI
jgi:acylpyruvate hydrolase